MRPDSHHLVSDSPFLVAKTTSKMLFTGTKLVTTGFNADGFDHEFWKKNARIIELYVIGILIAAGALGNILSVVVLKRDRQRRESLFLLRVLAVADLFYLIFASLRYPARYILPIIDPDAERSTSSEVNSPIFVRMQPFIFPCLKTTQTVTIWMTLLVAVDRFAWVRFPQSALKSFNAVTRRRYALLVCLLALLYNSPRFMDSKVFQLNLPCLPSSTPSIHPSIHPSNLTIQDKEESCEELQNFELNFTSISEEECDGSGWNEQINNIDDDGDDDDDGGGGDDDDGDGGDDNYFLSESMQDHEDQRDGVHYIEPFNSIPNVTQFAIPRHSQVTDSLTTWKIESERNNKPGILQRCTKRTIMSYRLPFSGPLYHNIYLDGMYLIFIYLLPLISITCINSYLIHAIRKSMIQRHNKCYYTSFKFANNNKTRGNWHSNEKKIKDCTKVDYTGDDDNDDDDDDDDDVIPPVRHCKLAVPKERRGEKHVAFSRYHGNCPAVDSCNSLIHNRNYLQHFQEHSTKYFHHQQCCHGYHVRQEAARSWRSNGLEKVRSDTKRGHQVTFDVDTRFNRDEEKRLADHHHHHCSACKHHHHHHCNEHVKKSRNVTLWIPFRGKLPSFTSVHNNKQQTFKHEIRLNGSEMNATLVLVVVVAVFVACESLELVLRMMTFSQRNLGLQLLNGERLAALTLASELTMVLKSTLNFLIYVTFGRRFRSFLRKVCPLRFPVLSSTSFASSPQKQAQII